MCGRFTQQRPASELAEIFGAEPLVDDPGGHYNVAPTDDALVVVQRDERRGLTAYRWGLIPHWATEARVGSKMINARAETITSSPAFRDAFVRKRCLVPVDSFYEWKREGTVRQPYRIVRRDGRPLALAGLWAGWKDPASDVVRRTFQIKKNKDGSYTLTRRDKGAFTTIGGASPGSCDTTGNHGLTVVPGVKGKLSGYIRGTVTGGTFNPNATCTASDCGFTDVFIAAFFGTGAQFSCFTNSTDCKFNFNYTAPAKSNTPLRYRHWQDKGKGSGAMLREEFNGDIATV